MRCIPLFLSLLVFCSCTALRYQPVESVTVDSIVVRTHHRDSIFERDSVYVTVKADTVYHTRTLYRYRDRLLRDTLLVQHCDTTVKVVEVERKLSSWQQKKMRLGEIFLALIPLLALYLFLRLRRL